MLPSVAALSLALLHAAPAREADLAADERFRTLFMAPEDLQELCRIVDEVFPTRTTAEWNERLAAESQRFAPVRDHGEVVADEDAVLIV